MARGSRRAGRAAKGRADAATKLIGVGIAATLVPLFLGGSLFGKVLGALVPVGLLMIAFGALFLWLERKTPSPTTSTPNVDRQAPVRPRRVRPAGVVDEPSEHITSVTSSKPGAPTQWGPQVFEVIEWRRFEAVVERLFAQAGFETKSQSHGADGGVDVWLYSRHKPGEAVSLVQCKHWQGKRVGVDKIRELRGVMASHNVLRGQFATTSTFTSDAEEFAKGNSINLLDVDRLLGLIGKRSTEQQEELLAVALEGEYWRPTCVNCGVKLVERTPRAGGQAFWGCPTYPKCKTTMPMRAR